MISKVTDVRYVENYTIWVRFSDGLSGEVDLSNELWGPVFEPLRNLEMFRKMRVDSDLDTLCWPNGADFAPEFLCALVVQGEARVDAVRD